MGFSNVKHVILVLSGKGGVGKSTVSAHLALSLRDLNKKIGLLDLDLCGPSIPHLLNLEEKEVHQCEEGWTPVYLDKSQMLCVMSIGFLLGSKEEAVVWRGPKKNAMVKQFLSDVSWPELDYLVVDMPPGTSDEHISLIESIRGHVDTHAVLVTTPQMIAFDDVCRIVTFCNTLSVPVLGIIENMSGFVCPNCSECLPVFSKGGGKALADSKNLNFLGSLPLDPQFTSCFQSRCAMENVSSETLQLMNGIAENISIQVNKMCS